EHRCKNADIRLTAGDDDTIHPRAGQKAVEPAFGPGRVDILVDHGCRRDETFEFGNEAHRILADLIERHRGPPAVIAHPRAVPSSGTSSGNEPGEDRPVRTMGAKRAD